MDTSPISKTLIENAKSVLIMEKAKKQVADMCDKHLNEYREKLTKMHPIKSNVNEWLMNCIQTEKVKITCGL
jgi:hypothetical protein